MEVTADRDDALATDVCVQLLSLLDKVTVKGPTEKSETHGPVGGEGAAGTTEGDPVGVGSATGSGGSGRSSKGDNVPNVAAVAA